MSATVRLDFRSKAGQAGPKHGPHLSNGLAALSFGFDPAKPVKPEPQVPNTGTK